MEDELQRALEQVQKMRDEKRPDFETVVEVFTKVFQPFGYRLAISGPDTYAWVDETYSAMNFEKWFVLSKSVMPGTEGYPLLTIRQSAAPRLDSWLSLSQLVVGPTEKDIEMSLAMALANHDGGMFGLRQSVADIITDFGGIKATAKVINDAMDTSKKDMN